MLRVRGLGVWGLALGVMLTGCTYAGHSIKGELGREIGDDLKGSTYRVGCEIKFERSR